MRITPNKILATTAATVLFAMPLFTTPIAAATPTGLKMSPVTFSGNYRPGEVINTSFSLENNTISSVTISLQKVAFNGAQLITDDVAPVTWTAIDKNELILAAGQSQTVEVTVTIPPAATTGAYFPAILVKQVSGATAGGSSTSIESNLTFPLAVNVTGSLPASTVRVTKLDVTNPVFTGNVTIDYEISNDLSLFAKPIGYLQILNTQNQPVFTTTINDALQMLQPGGKLNGSISAAIPLDLSGIGQYRVELLVLDKQFSTADILKANFLAVPIWLPVGIVVVGMIVLVVGSAFRKRGSNKKEN